MIKNILVISILLLLTTLSNSAYSPAIAREMAYMSAIAY